VIIENLVSFVGALLKHIIGVLLLCWRRMLRVGLITFGIGVVVAILIAVIGTGQAIPSAPALIVALLLGLALAYGAALTVLVEELILGVIDIIRMIEGDISAGAHIAEVVAEREVGEVGQGLRRLIGLPVSKRASTQSGAALPSLTSAQAKPQQPAPNPARSAAAVAELAATAAAAAGAATIASATPHAEPAAPSTASTTPASPTASTSPPSSTSPTSSTDALGPNGEPVPADRLPRIAWTYEHEAIRPAAAQPAASVAPIEEPVAPSTPSVAPIAEAAPVADATTPVVSEATTTVPARGDFPNTFAELAPASPPAPAEPATQEAPLDAPYDDERLAAPASVTTPEGPAEPAERLEDDPAEAEAAPAQPESPAMPALSSEADLGGAAPEQDVVQSIPVPVPAPATTPLPVEETDAQPVAAVDATQQAEPDASDALSAGLVDSTARSGSARRSLPLGEVDAAIEGPRASSPSGPRPSAPESGLWERLSSALINRAGAPSGPFASAPPSLPDDEPVADGAAIQEPKPDNEA
jgi:hypothetical protein